MITGLTSALNYCVAFVSVKLYVNMETSLTIFGVFLFFGAVNLFG